MSCPDCYGSGVHRGELCPTCNGNPYPKEPTMNQPSERCVWMRVGQAPCDPAQDHALACSYCREAWALVVPAEDVARAMLRLVGSEPLDEQRRRNV